MAVESLRPLERPPWCTAANIRRERGQVQKGGASGDCRLRLTAIMLRHKHSNSRGEGKPFTLTSVDDAD